MYCIGLTGTIASGKSTAISFFKKLGIDTLSADDIARQLTLKNTPALTKITHHFGKSILNSEGELNRSLLRQKILNHPDDRLWLENLLHPLIRKQIEHEIKYCKSSYCVIEIPLLTDRNTYPYLDRVLLITSDNNQQIHRLISRDQCSYEEAIKFVEHQEKMNNRHEFADDVICNNGLISDFHNQLLKHDKMYHLNAKPSHSQ